MAPPTRCTALDPTAHSQDGTPTDQPGTPAFDHPPRQRPSRLGIPANPRRARTARSQTRRLDYLEDPPRRRDRPDTQPNRPIMVRVHPLPVESHPGYRLRLCRHRIPTQVPRSVRHRGRLPEGAFGGDHRQPNRLLDYPSRPKPDEPPRRPSQVPVLDSRWCRTIHPTLRRCPRRIRDHRDQNTAAVTSSQRLRRTVGPDTPSRTPRPHHHLERTPTPTAPRGIRRALQQPSPAPRTPPPSTQRHRRRHPDRHRPTDPTSHNLRRAHQRIPNRSLNRPVKERVLAGIGHSASALAMVEPPKTPRE